MPRLTNPDPVDQARRLAAVKIMIKDMGDAMPGMARELRRGACETIDDIIGELTRLAGGRKAAAKRLPRTHEEVIAAALDERGRPVSATDLRRASR